MFASFLRGSQVVRLAQWMDFNMKMFKKQSAVSSSQTRMICIHRGNFCVSVSLHRNLLYSLPGKTPQFSILRVSQEAALRCGVTGKLIKHASEREALCHGAMNQSLSLILRAVQSAQRLVCFGLGLFENYPNKK